MHITYSILRRLVFGIILTALAALSLGGCGSGDGPAIEARPQTITFGTSPMLALGGTATVVATASSGLPVSYSGTTPQVCSVDNSTGIVTDIETGTCIIAANQSGNATFAPAPQVTQSIPVIFDSNQTISFGAAPVLSLGGTASVSATASSGLAVLYSSTTTAVCTVDSSTGLVTDLTSGACIIAASQAGDSNFNPAPIVIQTIMVSASSGATLPGAPAGVAATVGNTSNTVSVSFGATNSGGSPITGYTVKSSPAGLTASGPASPITVTCPSSCTGYAFSVSATNAAGSGPLSVLTDVITTYNVVETFLEPDTQPKNSIFIGTFTFNTTTRAVSNLRGSLSESMTGGPVAYPNDTMTWLSLNNQLSSVYNPTLGGLLVTTFLLPTTNTLSTNPNFGGTDGWSPGTGFGLHYGFPGANPGNAYAMIFVNTSDPTTALAQAQTDKLAYADCTPGGMMGASCMTGTTKAGYGTVGTMSGYPVSQVITKQ
ncbi:MAG: fibronectin type III domain-containing protein [Thermodesulfovibrionales bacterium]